MPPSKSVPHLHESKRIFLSDTRRVFENFTLQFIRDRPCVFISLPFSPGLKSMMICFSEKVFHLPVLRTPPPFFKKKTSSTKFVDWSWQNTRDCFPFHPMSTRCHLWLMCPKARHPQHIHGYGPPQAAPLSLRREFYLHMSILFFCNFI